MDLKSCLFSAAVASSSDKMHLSSGYLNRDLFLRLVKVGIESINSSRFIRKAVSIDNLDGIEYLVVDSNKFLFESGTHRLEPSQTRLRLKQNVYVAAFGKAALCMFSSFFFINKIHIKKILFIKRCLSKSKNC